MADSSLRTIKREVLGIITRVLLLAILMMCCGGLLCLAGDGHYGGPPSVSVRQIGFILAGVGAALVGVPLLVFFIVMMRDEIEIGFSCGDDEKK